MAGETRVLAEFATALRYEDIPASVIAITKACIIDTVAVALFGSRLSWSRSVEDFSHHVGSNGASTILSPAMRRVSAPVIPENYIRTDSRGSAESAHDPMRCAWS